MSGEYFDLAGSRICKDLESIAEDVAVRSRWPRLGTLLGDIAVLVEEAERTMDWDLSQLERIRDDRAFEDRIVGEILKSATKAAADGLFPGRKWDTVKIEKT